MTLTMEQIRARGLRALKAELGRAGMIRFLQQFETSSGDYAQWRHRWVDATSMNDIRRAARRKPRPRAR